MLKINNLLRNARISASLFTSASRLCNTNAPGFIGYDELKNYLINKSVVYLDVRNKSELKNDGVIPGSVNIPLPEIPEAFELNEEDFHARYGFRKPLHKADSLVIGCLYAVRSARARDYLQQKGYTGIRVYSGGFSEWKEKNNGGTS